MIEVLLAAGADLKKRNDAGYRPLHWAAAFNENPAVIEALLDAGADLNATDDSVFAGFSRIAFRYTALHMAAKYNENPAILKALIDAGADLDKASMHGSPLHLAAANAEDPAVVKLLLDAGADLEKRWRYFPPESERPLHYAAGLNENPAITQALIDAGADLEATDDGGRTPLHRAAQNNENPAVIEALIAAGADVNVRDEEGDTPLDLAAMENENPAASEVLIAAGATQNRRESQQRGDGIGRGIAAFLGAAAIASVGTEEAAEAAAVFAANVITGQQPVGNAGGAATSAGQSSVGTADIGLAGNPGVTVAGGSCQIPGFPNPGDMTNLGLSWCPARVEFQVRVFALQAEGMRCAVAANPSEATPEVVSRMRSQISEVCTRLDALVERLGGPTDDCRCPADFGP